MKHNKRTKQAFSFKVQIRNGRISVELALPTRWLIPCVTIIGALLSPTPIIKLIDILLGLAK